MNDRTEREEKNDMKQTITYFDALNLVCGLTAKDILPKDENVLLNDADYLMKHPMERHNLDIMLKRANEQNS